MEILTKKSLDAAIKKCQENKNYRVIVVTRYAESHTSVMDYLAQFKCNVVRRLNNPYVYFENGSVIRMLSSSSLARGYKASLVLCVSSVFDDENSYRFRAMELHNEFLNMFNNTNLMEEQNDSKTSC